MSEGDRDESPRWLLIPNLGAEEGPDWARFASLSAVAETIRLWRLIFPAANELISEVDELRNTTWHEALGPRRPSAAFAWLDSRPGAHAWLGDEPAREWARAHHTAWVVPEPSVTMAVHDKAFSIRQADRLGYEPDCLRGLPLVLEPETLDDPTRAIALIERQLADWPRWQTGRFVLKPRLGGSGRGRVAGKRDALERSEITRALARLSSRGGAILEPWLDRLADFSVALFIDPEQTIDGPGITLLGSLEQVVTPSGVPIGHIGEIDSRGRIFSGGPFDEELREAAVAIASAARTVGFCGPCGIDSFVFRGVDRAGRPGSVLRPILELNARYTLGIVAIGILRRLLARLRSAQGLSPGMRRGFLFALRPPKSFESWPDAARSLGGEALGINLSTPPDTAGPGVLIAANRSALSPLLDENPIAL